MKHVFSTEIELRQLVKDAVKDALAEVQPQVIEQPVLKEILTITDASELLNLAKPTIYGLTSKGEIPYFKKAKKLYFKRSELLEWLNGGRHKTNAEIEQEATNYLKSKRA